MSRPDSDSAKPNPASLAPVEYAFFQDGHSGLRIEYSLPLFHELDFQVNEGFRRIPHGGIEVGGFLWGKVGPDGLTIEAFRQISCEHASGPSFHLSPRDLDGALNLLTGAHADEELRDFEPVGWFIAHTRGPLKLSDRELALFDEWFPEPNRLTILVKPERFQATRFGFLVRDSSRSVARDAEASAIILPLPGRGGKGVAPSIPAPAAKPKPTPSLFPASPPASRQPVAPASVPVAEPAANTPPREIRLTPPAAPATAPPSIASDVKAAKPARPIEKSSATEEARSELPPPRKGRPEFRGVPPAPTPRIPAQFEQPARNTSVGRLFLWLLLAAALGCGVGYFAYLQLPSPYIPLQAERQANVLKVRWPAEQTRGLDTVAVRIDDGPPRPLSSEQKDAGELPVSSPGDNVKVEIIAQHWIRDSRGIIRYLSATPSAGRDRASAPAVPVQESPVP